MPSIQATVILSLRKEDDGAYFWQLNEKNSVVQRFNELYAMLDHARLRLAEPMGPPVELKNIYGELIGYKVNGKNAYFRDGMETSEPVQQFAAPVVHDVEVRFKPGETVGTISGGPFTVKPGESIAVRTVLENDNGADVEKTLKHWSSSPVATFQSDTVVECHNLFGDRLSLRPDLEMREKLKARGCTEREIRTVLAFSKICDLPSGYVPAENCRSIEGRYPTAIKGLYHKGIIKRSQYDGIYLRNEFIVPKFKFTRKGRKQNGDS